MKNKKLKIKTRFIHIEITLPSKAEFVQGIKDAFHTIIPQDNCKYCGGELEAYGSRVAICKNCKRKQ